MYRGGSRQGNYVLPFRSLNLFVDDNGTETVFTELEDDLFKISDSLEAFNELEKCTDHAILAQRSSERIDIRTGVVIKPGNPSQRHQYSIEGITADLSNGGCMALASRAILPGDLYWLKFSDDVVRIGTLIARCTRCRMVQDDAFEIGFRFLNNVSIKDLLR